MKKPISDSDKILDDMLRGKLKGIEKQTRELERKRKDIEAQIKELGKKRKAIRELIAGPGRTDEKAATVPSKIRTQSSTTHEQVIEKVVEFFRMNEGPAEGKQIMDYLNREGITFAGSTPPMVRLYVILATEHNKKKGKIQRKERGVYTLRKEEAKSQ
jgi:hypothetical protein